jgi:HAD superfamily hydrolase (TIGR01509 family)
VGNERPAAVVFDCDGVLVDSEVLVTRIEAELLRGLGVPVTAQEVAASFVRLSDVEMDTLIEAEWGLVLPPTFKAAKLERIAAVFEAELRPVNGIADVVAAVTVPRCVASSSHPDRIRRSLELTGLSRFFGSYLFSASMVTRGKPAPDLFLLAAEAMHARANRCLAIEDSAHGVTAGVAAGMTVIGFTAGGHCAPGLADRLLERGAADVAETSEALLSMLQDRGATY